MKRTPQFAEVKSRTDAYWERLEKKHRIVIEAHKPLYRDAGWLVICPCSLLRLSWAQR
jgi:hypothetical protein